MNHSTDHTFKDLLSASARSRGYPFLERAALWEERLAMHLKDLDTMLHAPDAGDMLLLPPRSKLEVLPPRAPAVSAQGTDDLPRGQSPREGKKFRRNVRPVSQ